MPIFFATSVLRGLRRTLEDVTGAIDSAEAEAGPTVEEECPVQKLAREPGQVSYDQVTGLPLDPKLVADAIKAELMFMRELQVYHEVLVSYHDKSGLNAIGTRWVHTNKGDAANPLIEQGWLRKKPHVRSHAPTGKPRGHAQSMYEWASGEHLLKRRFWDSTTSAEHLSTHLHVVPS